MFLASKLFWLLAQPLSLIFVLLVLSFLFAAAGLKSLNRFLSGLAVILLFLTLFTSTGTVALQVLGKPYPEACQPAFRSLLHHHPGRCL